jgi:hypothetical protein
MLTSQAESLSRSVELNSAGRTGVAVRVLLRLPVGRAVNAAILARAQWYRMFFLLPKTRTRLVATLLPFLPGVTLVGLIDPKRRTARVFSTVERSMLLRAARRSTAVMCCRASFFVAQNCSTAAGGRGASDRVYSYLVPLRDEQIRAAPPKFFVGFAWVRMVDSNNRREQSRRSPINSAAHRSITCQSGNPLSHLPPLTGAGGGVTQCGP